MMANAATRSLINDSDFGDNIMAALPDTIGQTIGGYVEDRIRENRVSQNIADINPSISSKNANALAEALVTGNDGSLISDDIAPVAADAFKGTGYPLDKRQLTALYGAGDKPSIAEALNVGGPTRSLTAGEAKLLSDLFGKSVDPTRIKVGWASALPDAPDSAVAITPSQFFYVGPNSASDIHEIFLPQLYRNDFSNITTAQDFRAAFDFVHESAYAWQMLGAGTNNFVKKRNRAHQ